MYCILYTRVTFTTAQLILGTLINPYKMAEAEFDEFVQSLPSLVSSSVVVVEFDASFGQGPE